MADRRCVRRVCSISCTRVRLQWRSCQTADRRSAGRGAARATGYVFRDHQLLQTRADPFQRACKAASNNERLEFLGDRVLGLVVAEMLLQALSRRA